MIDEFELMPQEEPFDPFAVMLFKALQVLAFLFFMPCSPSAPGQRMARSTAGGIPCYDVLARPAS
jgi:hypothetical protein